MNPDNDDANNMDELQSIEVIRQMIASSQRKLKSDGILFIIWGWLAFYNYFFSAYLLQYVPLSYYIKSVLKYLGPILFIAVLVYTIYYLYKKSKHVQTYIDISLRYVWIALIVCMMLVNLIQFNVLQSINFELQHPIFMVLIAFAITVTGGILRYRLIIFGGIFFGILALAASNYDLETQLLIDSFAWLVAFIIPGHIMYSQRNK